MIALTRWDTALPEKLVATGETKASAPVRATRASAIVLNILERALDPASSVIRETSNDPDKRSTTAS